MEASSVDQVLALVREQGGRATASRRALLEILFDADGHMSAEDLATAVQSRVPEVHMSTVYRNLDDLEELGVVTHTHMGHGPSTYVLSPYAHAHFICKQCGATFEAPDALFAGLSRSVRAKMGFTIDPHHFAILGTCAACS
jgi:Fe2+ or Zn2+ uptake regulation protein